jgi:CHASE3 domain sensor protein
MTRQKTARVGFSAALLIIAAIGWVAYRNTAVSIETARQVAHTYELLAELQAILSDVAALETARYAYVLANEERHLAPFSIATATIDQGLERLRRLTSDNPNQQQRISILKGLIDEKMAQLRHSIDVQRAEGFQPEAQMALADSSKALMDRIRWVIETMKGEERALLLRRDELLKSGARITYAAILLGVGLCVAVLSLVAYLFTREIAAHTRLEDESRKSEEGPMALTNSSSDDRSFPQA